MYKLTNIFLAKIIFILSFTTFNTYAAADDNQDNVTFRVRVVHWYRDEQGKTWPDYDKTVEATVSSNRFPLDTGDLLRSVKYQIDSENRALQISPAQAPEPFDLQQAFDNHNCPGRVSLNEIARFGGQSIQNLTLDVVRDLGRKLVIIEVGNWPALGE